MVTQEKFRLNLNCAIGIQWGPRGARGALRGRWLIGWVGAWVALLSHICPVINLFFTNHLIINIGVLIVTISTMHHKELTSMF